MSGREHQPVTAFFPSIDRNLILDLDRQLRNAAPLADPAMPAIPPQAAPKSLPRANVAGVVEAVEHAAQSIASMTTRIEELEAHIDGLESTNQHLHAQLGEALQTIQITESKLRAESERAARIEAVATEQAARAVDLERELSAAHGDLARITDAIAVRLGLPDDRAG